MLRDCLEASIDLVGVLLGVQVEHRAEHRQRAKPVFAEHSCRAQLHQRDALADRALATEQCDVEHRDAIGDQPLSFGQRGCEIDVGQRVALLRCRVSVVAVAVAVVFERVAALMLAFGSTIAVGLMKLRDDDATLLVVLVRDCIVTTDSKQLIDRGVPVDLVIGDRQDQCRRTLAGKLLICRSRSPRRPRLRNSR